MDAGHWSCIVLRTWRFGYFIAGFMNSKYFLPTGQVRPSIKQGRTCGGHGYYRVDILRAVASCQGHKPPADELTPCPSHELGAACEQRNLSRQAIESGAIGSVQRELIPAWRGILVRYSRSFGCQASRPHAGRRSSLLPRCASYRAD